MTTCGPHVARHHIPCGPQDQLEIYIFYWKHCALTKILEVAIKYIKFEQKIFNAASLL